MSPLRRVQDTTGKLIKTGKKPERKFLIDKLPIRSAEAVLLQKMFPQMKYIFSIRHPYDVVLSCFKQYFSPNGAMDNFTTIGDACHLYDFAMSQWFSVFSLESEQVCYVHYHRLVENLQDEVTRVLGFVGTSWDDGILQFARRSDDRGQPDAKLFQGPARCFAWRSNVLAQLCISLPQARSAPA